MFLPDLSVDRDPAACSVRDLVVCFDRACCSDLDSDFDLGWIAFLGPDWIASLAPLAYPARVFVACWGARSQSSSQHPDRSLLCQVSEAWSCWRHPMNPWHL